MDGSISRRVLTVFIFQAFQLTIKVDNGDHLERNLAPVSGYLPKADRYDVINQKLEIKKGKKNQNQNKNKNKNRKLRVINCFISGT